MRSGARLAMIVGGLGALAAGVGVYAAVPAANGVITTCYNIMKKSFRVIDTAAGTTCASGETMLSFNQVGPQGPIGVPGEPGDPGETGPSDLYYQHDQEALNDPGVQILPALQGTATIGTMVLPAGSYRLASTFEVENGTGQPQTLRCRYVRFSAVAVIPVGVARKLVVGVAPNLQVQWDNVSLDAVLSSNETATVALQCEHYNYDGIGWPDPLFARSILMTAIKVGAVHDLTP
jgi:hypothetical protein